MRSLITLIPLLLVLQGCVPTPQLLSSRAGSCDYSGQDEEKLQAAINAAYRWDVSVALVLGLLEADGPPWVKPRILDWDEYRMQSENWKASPDDLEDSAGFIGWFTHHSHKRIQLQSDQVADHYMALRLGQGGYHRGLDSASAMIRQDAVLARERTATWDRRLKQCPVKLTAEMKGSRWWNILN